MPAEKRYGGIQALRAISILLIVLSHLTVVEVKFGAGSPVLPPLLGRGKGGLDLFFIISGLMMVTITRGKYCSAHQTLAFLYHRLVRIYPLYWIYSLLVLPVYIIRPGWVNRFQGNRADLLDSFLLLPSALLPLLGFRMVPSWIGPFDFDRPGHFFRHAPLSFSGSSPGGNPPALGPQPWGRKNLAKLKFHLTFSRVSFII